MEKWKPIVGYEGLYEVSDRGNVRSITRSVKTDILHVSSRVIKGKALSLNLKSNGYYTVDLCKDGTVRSLSVHRLVALAFLPNPAKARVVNHKNGIKTDNCVSNLEWVSYKENHWHARKHGLLTQIGQYHNKPLQCVETETVFDNSVHAAEWVMSLTPPVSACKNVNVIAGNIRRCVRGDTPRAYGYHWKSVCQDFVADRLL